MGIFASRQKIGIGLLVHAAALPIPLLAPVMITAFSFISSIAPASL
jgi:hypothetical protein